jgi:hypothetical protein
MNIEWSDDERLNSYDTFDLCGKFNGKYVDVCYRYDNTWSILYDGTRIKNGFATRDLAKSAIVDWLEKLNKH